METITFKLRNGPNDNSPLVDSAYLPQMTNELATYGIKRKDNDAVVVPAHTNLVPQVMTRDSLGTYHFDFAEPSANLIYIYSIKFKVGIGPDFFIEGQHIAAVDVPTNLYTTYDALIKRWGQKNIKEASNKDAPSSATIDYDAVQEAFDFATDEVHDTLRGGVLKVPLDFTAYSNVIPKSVVEWIHVLTFGWLYDVRGWDDRNKVGNKFSRQIDSVYRQMWAARNGLRQIQAASASTTSGHTITQEISTVRSFVTCYRFPGGMWKCA